MSDILPKFELDLNKQSEIGFEVNIAGTSTEDVGSPIYRFLISDPETGKGNILPAKKNIDDDVVNIKLYPLKEGFLPNKNYRGKLEIIVGSLYFAPTEVDLFFTESMQVEVKPIINGAKKENNKDISVVAQKNQNNSTKKSVKITEESKTEKIELDPDEIDENLEKDLQSVIAPEEKKQLLTQTKQIVMAEDYNLFSDIQNTKTNKLTKKIVPSKQQIQKTKIELSETTKTQEKDLKPIIENNEKIIFKSKIKSLLKDSLK